jgi:hypothetical protein
VANEPSAPKEAPSGRLLSRRNVGIGGLTLALFGLIWWRIRKPFPPDTTPEGAYLRIAQSLAQKRIKDAFAYLEDEAQWACFSIRDERQKAWKQIEQTFPESEKASLRGRYEAAAKAADGAELWALLAEERGFRKRLARDMSGITKTELSEDRATITTAQGTRYTLRRRKNGIWGLTMFTAELIQERANATRDAKIIAESSADYIQNRKPNQ